MQVSRALSIWRKNFRGSLLRQREAIEESDREKWNAAITNHVLSAFPLLSSMAVGFYWPYRGEVDARYAVNHLRTNGATAALPMAGKIGEPLRFLEWWPGASMRLGVYDIPFPNNTRSVKPQALLVAPVGFDEAGYRLGYGGGYYDNTLVAMQPQPLKIALAFELSRIPTIHPRPHDVPMDFIVTERGVHHVSPQGLHLIHGQEALRLARKIMADRLVGSRHARRQLDHELI